MLKTHIEMHGSYRDCNQVIRKLMMSRSQLLNTLGQKYKVAIQQKIFGRRQGPICLM